ncbi:MAG: Asp-tRNA(Asn)/Glu-tRNA(Gln) amidotransferase subunit GatB [Desulfovibrio sp.]|nr:Asp-tRNA(Asn)/Glu-tRNA(Gln) amidotransferase subunit GatB [Desulfovibrio sp.]
MSEYEAVIGLEVHAQLKTASKLFCSCPAVFGGEPNEQVCEVCAGLPGALPRLNEKAVELAVKAGLAMNCTINNYSLFSRKNYFYPDLPDGYQTSQFAPPVCEKGYLEFSHGGETKRVGITRIHMENDAGKCLHVRGATLVDLNRAGTPLIEIVSEPDLRGAEEAAEFMRQVHAILVCIGATDGNMEEGSLRCDANVSLRPVGSEIYGVRTETKNINSFRNVQKAVDYEIARQKVRLDDGEAVVQETRLFDAARQITLSMRNKEDAHDYRYFPNPDLPPVIVDPEKIEEWRAQLPELPAPRARRFVESFGLTEEDAAILVSDKAAADYFEAAVALFPQGRRIAALMRAELLRECEAAGLRADEARFAPADLAELAGLIDSGEISARTAHEIFPELFVHGGSPASFVRERGLSQISDSGELGAVVDAVLAENPDEVAACRGGKTKLLSFFVGKVMARTGGKANPALVNSLLRARLEAGSTSAGT